MTDNIVNTAMLGNLIASKSQPEALRRVAGQCNRSSSDDELLDGVSGKIISLSGAPVDSTCSTIIQVDEAFARI